MAGRNNANLQKHPITEKMIQDARFVEHQYLSGFVTATQVTATTVTAR